MLFRSVSQSRYFDSTYVFAGWDNDKPNINRLYSASDGDIFPSDFKLFFDAYSNNHTLASYCSYKNVMDGIGSSFNYDDFVEFIFPHILEIIPFYGFTNA